MKQILTLLIILFSFTAFAQQITYEEWDKQTKTDKRLLPKYGQLPKSKGKKQSDEKFINEIMRQEQFKGDRTAASNHLIELGFNYLYRGDLKTAMYRFNQAYLLDSTNTDIYWGYGTIYMTLGSYEKAKKQYTEGLSLKPDNTHLLTDYGTYFMGQYYALQPLDERDASSNLDSAITYMTKSYELDAKDQNTVYKLSICYWIIGDCDNAWKYYHECKSLGGRPITEAYTKDLKEKCDRER